MKRHIPNLITLLNLLIGTAGILVVTNTRYWPWAIIFVLIAGIFDFLDGLFARLLKVQSEIGKQLDSLADLISFGLLPSMSFVMLWMEKDTTGWLPFIGFLIVAFSTLRLAKFNISDDQTTEFKGLPTPANAIAITAIVAFNDMFDFTLWSLILIVLISCLLMVANIRMMSFKMSSMDVKSNWTRYLLLLLIVAGLIVFNWNFVPFIIPTYIVISLVGNYLITPFVSKEK